MNFNEAIEYLTRCADAQGNHWYQGRIWAMSNCPNDIASCPTCKGTNDAGHLGAPGSRYGHTSAHCAPIAYRVAKISAAEMGEEITTEALDYAMGMVVNDSDSPASILEEYAVSVSGADVDAMVTGYLEAVLWTQTDYDRDDDSTGEPMLDANYDVDDIDPEYVAKVRVEFAELIQAYPLAVRMYLNSARDNRLSLPFNDLSDRSALFGHDYLLTRDGHGAGFWDRCLGELGDYLTDIAKHSGSHDELWDNGTGVLA